MFAALVKAMVRKRLARRCHCSPQDISAAGSLLQWAQARRRTDVRLEWHQGPVDRALRRSVTQRRRRPECLERAIRRGLGRPPDHLQLSHLIRRLWHAPQLWRSRAVQRLHAGHGAAAGRDPARLLADQQLHRLELQRDHRDGRHACHLAVRQFLLAGDGLRLLPRHLPAGGRRLLRHARAQPRHGQLRFRTGAAARDRPRARAQACA